VVAAMEPHKIKKPGKGIPNSKNRINQ